MIDALNHLLIIDSRRGPRLKKKDTKFLPLPLILSIVRNSGNAIDIEIPVKGSLKDPKFVLRYAIWEVIRNIFVKPPRTPYLTKTTTVENEVERFLTVKWQMRQSGLDPENEKFMKRIATFLRKNPETQMSVYPIIYKEKEKEYALFYEAKKKYYLSANPEKAMTEDDSLTLDKMSIKDSCFLSYLNNKVKDTMMFTIQEKCRALISEAKVNSNFKRLNSEREKEFMAYFDTSKVKDQIKIHDEDYEIPFNGFSYYKLVYKGDIPEDLLKAYYKLNEINTNGPRGKYLKERKKNKEVLKLDM
jgi:hypothetical protein